MCDADPASWALGTVQGVSEWGWTPEVVAAVGAAGSAVAAIIALIFARTAALQAGKVLERELARDEAREQRDKQAQADRVAAWPALGEPMEPDGSVRGQWALQARGRPPGAWVANDTPVPVYDVEVRWWTLSGGPLPPEVDPVTGESRVVDDGGIRVLHVQRKGSIPPPGAHLALDDDGIVALLSPVGDLSIEDYRLEVWFTDAAGWRWQRDWSGGLWEHGHIH